MTVAGCKSRASRPPRSAGIRARSNAGSPTAVSAPRRTLQRRATMSTQPQMSRQRVLLGSVISGRGGGGGRRVTPTRVLEAEPGRRPARARLGHRGAPARCARNTRGERSSVARRDQDGEGDAAEGAAAAGEGCGRGRLRQMTITTIPTAAKTRLHGLRSGYEVSHSAALGRCSALTPMANQRAHRLDPHSP